jgi:hypothetical protein
MTDFDMQALACEDCPAEVIVGRTDGVLTVAVEHEPSCPWLTRVVGGRTTRVESSLGVLVHTVKSAS